jgi:hypothetical protein
MNFGAGGNHWWMRGAAAHDHSLEGRWLPMLGLGGLVATMLIAAWRYHAASEAGAAAPPVAAHATGPADFHQLPAVQIRLRADAAGRLSSIAFNGRTVRNAIELRAAIREFLGPAAQDATIEAELDCDGRLRYEDTRQVIDAISAYPASDGRTMVPLVDRVKFSPRKN